MIYQQQFIKHTGMLSPNLDKTGILLSGGMDSICIAYWKRPAYAFTINYGQKSAAAEIHAASQISKILNMKHYVINIDCSSLGTGDLSGNEQLSLAPASEWWPYRNQLLVTLACMKGISIGLEKLIVGSVKTDSFHIDGSREFYEKINDLIKLQEGNIEIDCPALNMNTVELIKVSKIPISLLRWAHSCHTSNEPCMRCHGCQKYLYVMQELNEKQ